MNIDLAFESKNLDGFARETKITQTDYTITLTNSEKKASNATTDVFQAALFRVNDILRAKIGYNSSGNQSVYDIDVQTPDTYEIFGVPTEKSLKQFLQIPEEHDLLLNTVTVSFPLQSGVEEKAKVSLNYVDAGKATTTTVLLKRQNLGNITEAANIATNTHGSLLPGEVIKKVENGEQVPCWYVEVSTNLDNPLEEENFRNTVKKALVRLKTIMSLDDTDV